MVCYTMLVFGLLKELKMEWKTYFILILSCFLNKK